MMLELALRLASEGNSTFIHIYFTAIPISQPTVQLSKQVIKLRHTMFDNLLHVFLTMNTTL